MLKGNADKERWGREGVATIWSLILYSLSTSDFTELVHFLADPGEVLGWIHIWCHEGFQVEDCIVPPLEYCQFLLEPSSFCFWIRNQISTRLIWGLEKWLRRNSAKAAIYRSIGSKDAKSQQIGQKARVFPFLAFPFSIFCFGWWTCCS